MFNKVSVEMNTELEQVTCNKTGVEIIKENLRRRKCNVRIKKSKSLHGILSVNAIAQYETVTSQQSAEFIN